MSKELDDKKQHLESLETFLRSPAHKGFVASVKFDIGQTENAIVMNDPLTRADEIENFKLRGELRCLQQMLTTFEDARVTLKDRINEIVERELENATNQKV